MSKFISSIKERSLLNPQISPHWIRPIKMFKTVIMCFIQNEICHYLWGWLKLLKSQRLISLGVPDWVQVKKKIYHSSCCAFLGQLPWSWNNLCVWLLFMLFVPKFEARYCIFILLLFVCTGGLFLIIFRKAMRSGVYLTLETPLLCVWRSLFEIWLSDGVYLTL